MHFAKLMVSHKKYNISKPDKLNLRVYAFILVLSSIFLACNNVKPLEPQKEAFLDAPVQKLSTINLPIYFEVHELERKINDALSGEFYNNGLDEENEPLKISLSKHNDVRIKMVEDKMITTLPLEVRAEILMDKKVVGIRIKKKQKLNFKVNIDFESEYSINSHWQIITKTQLKELHWLKEPKIKLAFINFKVTKQIEKALAKNEAEILKSIDQEIKENVKLDQAIVKIWKDLQKPILLNREIDNVWLKVVPTAVSAGKVQSNGKHIFMMVAIDAELHSIIGDSISAYHMQKLPSLKINQAEKEFFDLNLLSKVPFEKINKVLDDSLKGKEIIVKDQAILVKKAYMWGNGEKIILKLDIEGAANGTLYFKGKPAFDPVKEELTINEFSYDMHTEELILKIANWLYHESFTSQIQQQLRLPLANQLNKVPSLIENAIENGKSGEKISINIDEMKIKPDELVVRPDGIYTLINAKGKVSLQLENI